MPERSGISPAEPRGHESAACGEHFGVAFVRAADVGEVELGDFFCFCFGGANAVRSGGCWGWGLEGIGEVFKAYRVGLRGLGRWLGG